MKAALVMCLALALAAGAAAFGRQQPAAIGGAPPAGGAQVTAPAGEAGMIDPETLKYLASLGVGGVLAGIIFVLFRRDSLQWQEAWKGQSQMLLQVVKENTTAMVTLGERLDALADRLERDGRR